MDKIVEEELICSLAVRGEKSIHKLLLNILAIVKQLKTIQSDPVIVYQVSTKAHQQLQSQQLQQNANTNSNNTTPTNNTGTLSSTTTNNKSDSSTSPTLNLNFVNDSEKIKELNQNCIASMVNLSKIIKEIVGLELKIKERDSDIEINSDNNNDNKEVIDNENIVTSTTTTTDKDQNSLSNELEKLKLDAYQKNCIIKKLIDNMRLLQLSINSMNRTSTGTD